MLELVVALSTISHIRLKQLERGWSLLCKIAVWIKERILYELAGLRYFERVERWAHFSCSFRTERLTARKRALLK